MKLTPRMQRFLRLAAALDYRVEDVVRVATKNGVPRADAIAILAKNRQELGV